MKIVKSVCGLFVVLFPSERRRYFSARALCLLAGVVIYGIAARGRDCGTFLRLLARIGVIVQSLLVAGVRRWPRQPLADAGIN